MEAGSISFAYRRFGSQQGTPVVFVQHFMGNLDDHDPAITDALAQDREVILFNNAGVASSTGTTPDTIEQTASDAESFIDALGLGQVDLLAHSMGGLVGQQIATDRPELVRKLILVGTGPRGGEGIGAMPAETEALFFTTYEHQEDMWLPILFSPSKESQAAGREFLNRIMARTDRDAPVAVTSVQAQASAIGVYGARKDRLRAPRLPPPADSGGQRQQRHRHPDNQLLHPPAAPARRHARSLPRCQPRVSFPVPRAIRRAGQDVPERTVKGGSC